MNEFNHDPKHFERNNRVVVLGAIATVVSVERGKVDQINLKFDNGTFRKQFARWLELIYDQPSPMNPDDIIHNSEFTSLVDDSEVVNGLTVYQLEDGRTVTVEYDGSLTVNDDINYDPRQPLVLGSTMIAIPTDAPKLKSDELLKRFEVGDRVCWDGYLSEVLGTVTGWYEPYYGPTSGPQTPLVVVKFDDYDNEVRCEVDEITYAATPTAEEKAKADAAFAMYEKISKESKREYAIEVITDAFEMLNQAIADFYTDLVQNEDAYGLPMNKVQSLLADARIEFESLADGDYED